MELDSSTVLYMYLYMHVIVCVCVCVCVLINGIVFRMLFWFVYSLNGRHRDFTMLVNLDVELLFIYLFMFGCIGSSLLLMGFL